MTTPHLTDDAVTEPLGVVPIDREVGEVAGHLLVLLSLERWASWADLRFARIDRTGEHRLGRRVPPAGAWRVTVDDVELAVREVVGRGDRRFSNGEVRLAPTPRIGCRMEVRVSPVVGAEPLAVSFVLGDHGRGPVEGIRHGDDTTEGGDVAAG